MHSMWAQSCVKLLLALLSLSPPCTGSLYSQGLGDGLAQHLLRIGSASNMQHS